MTNAELEAIFKENAGNSTIAALRVIYNLGYCDGASITPSVGMVDRSQDAAKPSSANIQIVKVATKKV